MLLQSLPPKILLSPVPLPQPLLPQPPQQESKRMIQIQDEQPQSLLLDVWHPQSLLQQLVAAKSLMLKPPKEDIYF